MQLFSIRNFLKHNLAFVDSKLFKNPRKSVGTNAKVSVDLMMGQYSLTVFFISSHLQMTNLQSHFLLFLIGGRHSFPGEIFTVVFHLPENLLVFHYFLLQFLLFKEN